MKTSKDKKPTPEQLKEQRLWKAADKACRALMENVGNEVRAGHLTFTLDRGVTLGFAMSLTFNVKVPKQKKNPWSLAGITSKKGKRGTVFRYSG